ncbi:PREDICTED: uncharacterized protein LOC18606756 [Theobroma cacao]|uniref:Uncharacterized protein LOC18606756 n=1 Tax=Theobroma cacao TaxID=3641 RepID=A0AB32VY80_THECC|nr:PREDICTED: uncharacterized protein LOC18606756 [Theobroma cacao]XP_017972693.1 PREDICTED: uncharacterized protein LOC18606756 [Theobroma cacao]
MEDFSAFAAFQADDSERTPDQRGSKRPLTEAQRIAKNERDRERRQEHKVEFERLQSVEFQFNQIAPQFKDLRTQLGIQTNIISKLKQENQRLKNRESHLNKRIEELGNALPGKAAPDRNYRTRKKSLLVHGNQLQPVALIGGEINQMVWNTATVRPQAHLQLMPDLSISAAVQTQVIPAIPAESVIDKETVTNQFTMNVPFLFVASKTEEVTCIRLRGKCSASPEGDLLQYLFEWIPHQTNQESWENLGWSPSDVGLIQNMALSSHTSSSCGAQPCFPIKLLLWNSVGTLNTYGQMVVMDLINRFRPAVLVIAETKLSRARAKEIIDTFHFDAHRVTPNLGFVGGMWLLWRSDVVEVEVLSFTEQEIHALIKEPQTNQNPSPWEIFRDVNFDSLEEAQSFLVSSPTAQVANSEPVTEAQGSDPQTGNTKYADQLVEDFTKKLDAMDQSKVDFSDFEGLKEELEASGIGNLPPSLAPIDERIKMMYGDITADSRQSPCIVRPSYILLCSVIKEMDELTLDQVDEKKMLFWGDAINSGLRIGLRGSFAIDHLKNIARAYYGLKAWNEQGHDQKYLESIQWRMSELQIELRSLEEKHAKKLEERESEVRRQCIHVAEQFWGKPLSTYLFPQLFPGCNSAF